MGSGANGQTVLEGQGRSEQEVQVTVEYLAAVAPFHRTYPGQTPLETVRTEAMAFFGVRDRARAGTYEYFLEFERQRVTNTSQALDQLLGQHRRGAHFNLVEQITPGTARQ